MQAVKQPERILVVIDPTADAQPAMQRAMYLAEHLEMALDLFICHYQPAFAGRRFFDSADLKQARKRATDEKLAFLRHLAESHRDYDVPIGIQVAWDEPLHEGIIREALRTNARYVLKDTHYHSAVSRAMFTNTDWHLIRDCPSPLWLVKQDQPFTKPCIMAAVDPMHEHDKPASLDRLILYEAFDLERNLDGNVHAVHGFNVFPAIAESSGSGFGPTPIQTNDIVANVEKAHAEAFGLLTDEFAVTQERTHLISGNVTDLLPYMAREVAANLVVMGAVARSRLERAIVGSTAERVLAYLPCDVLIIKPEGFVSPVTIQAEPRWAAHTDRDDIYLVSA